MGPIDNFTCPSETTLDTDMGSVELILNPGSQTHQDDALWTLENNTILSNQVISHVEVLAQLSR